MSAQALSASATGMIAQARNLDVIANNLANVGTDGYKKQRANFEDLLYKVIRMPGAGPQGADQTPSQGLQFGVGTRVSATQFDFRSGPVRQTGRPLDLLINGTGMFTVDDGQGNLFYTRAGNFTINSQGQVIMATSTAGYVLQPPITIPDDAVDIAVASDGQVLVTQPGTTTPQIVGTIDATRFQNPEGLQAVGNNLFQETGASGAPQQGQFNQQGYGAINQGYLESSNVEPVEELINLIQSQRAFELNSQVVQAANENLRTVGTLRQ